MMNQTTTTIVLTEAQKGPADKLLDLTLNASAHLWHNRPGLDVGGNWHARRGAKKDIAASGTPVKPGLHVPAAERLYARLLDIHRLNGELMARFASYALTQTEWRACEGGEHLPLLSLVASSLARAIQDFVADGARRDAMVSLSGVVTTGG